MFRLSATLHCAPLVKCTAVLCIKARGSKAQNTAHKSNTKFRAEKCLLMWKVWEGGRTFLHHICQLIGSQCFTFEVSFYHLLDRIWLDKLWVILPKVAHLHRYSPLASAGCLASSAGLCEWLGSSEWQMGRPPVPPPTPPATRHCHPLFPGLEATATSVYPLVHCNHPSMATCQITVLERSVTFLSDSDFFTEPNIWKKGK